MSLSKIEKMLALAYGTSSKEEAMNAFGKAVVYANRSGVDLKTVRFAGAPEPQRNGNFHDPFGYGGNSGVNMMEVVRLRMALQREQADHESTSLAYGAEVAAHTKTAQALQETRFLLADREYKIEAVRSDVHQLGEMFKQLVADKNVELEHKDFEIAALRRQIELMQQQQK